MLTDPTTLLLAGLFLLAAALYSSVGHAGASAYLAAMALVGIEPAVMKPTALCLNVLVASIATVEFARAGCFRWRLFWPLALTSAPAAWASGRIDLPAEWYNPLIGSMLLFAAYRMAFSSTQEGAASGEPTPPQPGWLAVLGTGIGVVAGLTGTGGGIFLSPLLLMLGWADTRRTAGVSAPFVLVNTLAGLAAWAGGGRPLPPQIPLWAAAAVLGGLVGAYFGSRRLRGLPMRRVLAVVLLIASVKLFLPAG